MRLTIGLRREMVKRLAETYRGATTGLLFNSPFELLVAVILSAQCTDVRVNMITRRLFPKWDTPKKMLEMSQEQLEELIHDCGLFRSKAKNILGTCRILVETYHGEVPGTMEKLIQLPGVGRKTANVVLSHQFGVPAIAVDTHVFRVANRTGIARGRTPGEVEQVLMKLIPRSKWSDAHHWLIWHGRKVCRSRSPLCRECCLQDICPFAMAPFEERQEDKV